MAEKCEAMVQLGERNSRMKDFYDLWYLSHTFDFDGALVTQAITNTFRRRKTALPAEVPVPVDTERVVRPEALPHAADHRPGRLVDLLPRPRGLRVLSDRDVEAPSARVQLIHAERETLKALDLAANAWELSLARKQLQEIRRLMREGTQKPEWTKSLTKPALVLMAMVIALSLMVTWK